MNEPQLAPTPDKKPEIIYVGPKLPPLGQPGLWDDAAHMLLGRGESAWTALTCVALALGAPMSRLIGKRNPVIGLVDDSSRGKGTVINFALSAWLPPDWLTIPAGSTAKGLQDKAVTFWDYPIFCDELQQLLDRDPRLVADALYFLGNGQRRVTSSKEQTAKGGDRRYGVAFFAAERPVTPGLNLGVQYRVWELDGPPLPYPDQALIETMQRATQFGSGRAGDVVGDIIQRRKRPAWEAELKDEYDIVQASYPGLAGDDAAGLTVVRWGLDALKQILACDVPGVDLLEWLVARLRVMRARVVDRESAAWSAMIDLVLNGERGNFMAFIVSGQVVGWGNGTPGNLLGLEINPASPPVAMLLKNYGSELSLLRAWGSRKWIEHQGDSWKVKKRIDEGFGRVIRLTDASVAKLNKQAGL